MQDQGSNLNVIIPPKGNHGSNAVKELGGFFVMLNKSLVGVEGTSDIGVGNDFRRIGLLEGTNFNFDSCKCNYKTTTICD